MQQVSIPLRRVLTILTAIVLSVASLAVGLFTADLPFWQRALRLPLDQDEIYLPVAVIGADRASVPPPLAADAPASEALEFAARRARDAGSRALLVQRGDQLLLSRYFGVDDEHTLLPADVIARPVTAMALGLAVRDGQPSLDGPVSQYLEEWEGEPRGRITLRQLLEETSGLESGGDTRGFPYRSPWHEPAKLPAFATSRGVRMLLGNDFESSALGFRLEHEPGGFHNRSPANAQLAAVIVERTTGEPYESFVDQKIWRPLGAGFAELQLDRRAGMPAAHCCWRATARDMMRVLGLLGTDGVQAGHAVLPAGWAREMARASRVDADSGMQVTRLNIDGVDALEVKDDSGSAFWIFPQRELAILDITNPGANALDDLPGLLLKGTGVSAPGP